MRDWGRDRLLPALAFAVLFVGLPLLLMGQVSPSPVHPSSGGVSTTAPNTWTGIQTFLDTTFFVVDNSDQTKKLRFDTTSVSTGSEATVFFTGSGLSVGVFGAGFDAVSLRTANGNPFTLRDGGGGAQQFMVFSHRVDTQGGKTLTDAVTAAVTQLAVASGARSGATINWTVVATDATDHQSRRGSTYLAVVNKAGVETCVVSDAGTSAFAASLGTLAVVTSCSTSPTNAVDFSINADTSLAGATILLTYQVMKDAVGALTAQ